MRYIVAGTSLSVDKTRCVGCGRCEEVCPHGVLSLVDGKAAIVGRERCMECGACRMNCPVNAIQVSSGVGCAQAVINGLLSREETCGSCDSGCSCG